MLVEMHGPGSLFRPDADAVDAVGAHAAALLALSESAFKSPLCCATAPISQASASGGVNASAHAAGQGGGANRFQDDAYKQVSRQTGPGNLICFRCKLPGHGTWNCLFENNAFFCKR